MPSSQSHLLPFSSWTVISSVIHFLYTAKSPNSTQKNLKLMKEKRNLKNHLFKNEHLLEAIMVTNDVMLLYLCAGFGWGRVTFFTAVIINAICSTSLKHSHELVTGKKTNLSQDKISTIEKSNAYLKYIV